LPPRILLFAILRCYTRTFRTADFSSLTLIDRPVQSAIAPRFGKPAGDNATIESYLLQTR
jgi:hypothetical protein